MDMHIERLIQKYIMTNTPITGDITSAKLYRRAPGARQDEPLCFRSPRRHTTCPRTAATRLHTHRNLSEWMETRREKGCTQTGGSMLITWSRVMS